MFKRRPQLVDAIGASYRAAITHIESNLAARSQRYSLPWAVVIRSGQDVTGLALEAAGLASALKNKNERINTHTACHWSFFDQGIVIELAGTDLSDQDESVPASWEEFLRLCRRYRPERPFDAMVVTIPASALRLATPENEAALVARAQAVYRSLWVAQNRFALQFPVYVLITGCEVLPSFSSFARSLPTQVQRSMLGWSSPSELGASFRSEWVDVGLDEITRDVEDLCAEMGASAVAGQDSLSYFMLPTELGHLRAGMKCFLSELMRPSAHHEPFIFRGFYLTGDKAAPAADHAAHTLDESSAETLSGLPADPLTPESSDTAAVWALPPEPVFLRDVFEKKIFSETGLVQPSRLQHLRSPAIEGWLRIAAVALPLAWAIGLALGTVRLSHATNIIVEALTQIDRDGRSVSKTADPARDRERSITTLTLLEKVNARLYGSVLMPGSWPWIDDLRDRLQSRLERGFSENAMDPIRLGAYARVSALTGAPLDAATGYLIAGAACTGPAASRLPVDTVSAINPEDMPEYSALSKLVDQAEEIDRALRSLDQLTVGTEPASGEDLRRVARVFLGADIRGDLHRTAGLVRQHARKAPTLSVPSLSHALTCAFHQSESALHIRLFENNPLLLSEQGLATDFVTLIGHTKASGWQQALTAWSSLRDAINRQEVLLSPGQGAWMRNNTMQLGQAYEILMQRMQAVSLVGPEAVSAARKQAAQGHERMMRRWDHLLAGHHSPLGPGLLWHEKEGRWAFTPERQNFDDALTILLSQPYFKPGQRKLPQITAGFSVVWDRARLDQALVLAEMHKKFEADLLPKVPVAARDDIDNLVRRALAEGVVDLLAQATSIVPASSAPIIGETERVRLTRARTVLNDLGAASAATRLGQLIDRDAMGRLQSLDDMLRQSDVYQPNDPGFRQWLGEKGPMVSALGAADAAGLATYAAQLNSFVDTLAREAETLLPSLNENNSSALVKRWRAITAEMVRYRLKSPASSLAALEQFILVSTIDIDISNCADRLRSGPRRAGDYFSDRLVSLQSALIQRCRELRLAQNRDSWHQFAEIFNRDLAGRAPFRNWGAPVGSQNNFPAADVGDANLALASFERLERLLSGRDLPNDDVRRFIEQMSRVRAFMTPLFLAQEGAATGYDLTVEFRANSVNEVEGNKIIDWSLSVGDQTIRSSDASRPLRWQSGQPIALHLRLARDAPLVARSDPAQPALRVDQARHLSFSFNDPWALYTLLATHRESEGLPRDEARPQLLRFEFPLVPASDAVLASTEPSRARVFIRLAISPLGKRSPLVWPGFFPTRAPQWGAP